MAAKMRGELHCGHCTSWPWPISMGTWCERVSWPEKHAHPVLGNVDNSEHYCELFKYKNPASQGS